MKKIITLVFLAACSVAHAQKVFGIKGGLNQTNLSNAFVGGLDESRQIQSFHAGVSANFPFLIFSFQPSLLVSGKGARVTYGDPNSQNYFVSTTNPIYLELPATFNINIRLGDKTGVYAGAGPYIAMGLGGKNAVSGYREDGTYFSYKEKITYSNDDPKTLLADEGAAYGKLRRYDYGVQFGAGVIIAGITVAAFYDFGLTPINTISNGNQNDKLRNRTLGLSVGYMFGRG
jgi:hypothetical protein